MRGGLVRQAGVVLPHSNESAAQPAWVQFAVPFHVPISPSFSRPASVQIASLDKNINFRLIYSTTNSMSNEMPFVPPWPESFLGRANPTFEPIVVALSFPYRRAPADCNQPPLTFRIIRHHSGCFEHGVVVKHVFESAAPKN